MKIKLTIFCLLAAGFAMGQTSPVVSHVYSWDSSAAGLRKGTARPVFSGSGAILAKHSMTGVTMLKGETLTFNPDSPVEKFFIVKNGPVKVQMNDSMAVLDRGSVISLQPGSRLVLMAVNNMVQLYEMDYVSIAPADAERGRKAGGSFMMDWNQIVFKPHDKGGVRQFFDRQTAMLNRFDIHVTTLNPNNKSHDPHTHKNEEIILMLQGNAEMQIGTDHEKANSGDVVFLGSNVLHNLTNIGTVPCIYYAIQWN